MAEEPFYVQWHVTGRCNLSCRHCYREGGGPEPSLEDLRAAFERIRALCEDLGRRVRVQLTGGEPLLSAHLRAVMEWIAREGWQIRVLSNGTLASPRAARELVELGCSSVQVSLEGGSAAHDALRGPGSHAAAVAGARVLREHGIPVTLAMTLSRSTAPDVPELLRIAADHADRVGFHRLVPVGGGAALASEVLSAAQLREAFAAIWRSRAEHPRLGFSLRDPLWRAFRGGSIAGCAAVGCTAGNGGICIEADGTVFACRRLPVAVGNVLRDDLRELWRGPLLRRLRERRLGGACGRCVYLHVCGGCRAVAWALRGSPFAADPQCFRRPGLFEGPLREIARTAEAAALRRMAR